MPLTTRRSAVRRLGQNTQIWILCIDIVLVVIFGLMSPGRTFLSGTSFQNIGFDASEIVLLAGAATVELAAAQIDVSLGAVLVLSSVIGGEVMTKVGGTAAQVQTGVYPHLGLALTCGCLAAVATGALFGLLNGFVVTRLRVSAFIGTLGTTGIGTGIALILTKGTDLAYLPQWLQAHYGAATIGGIPAPALTVAIFVVLLWVVMRFTRFGLRAVAIGSSEASAMRAGINVNSQIVLVFVLAGCLCGVAGILDLARFATTNVSGHTLDALAAVGGAVIGGTSLFGGNAAMGGAVVGALLSVILQDGLVTVGLSPFYEQLAVGVVLIIAVWADQRSKGARRA